jgi:general stress protein 26
VISLALFAGAALSLAAPQGPAPAAAGDAPPSRERILAVAREVMSTARYATLVTLGADGHPQARIVDPTDPSPEFAIWIGTNPKSRKVLETRRDPRATLSYFDEKGGNYVTIKGRLTFVLDRAERAERFKDAWAAFYKDRDRGPDFTMLRFTPSSLEVSAESKGVRNDPVTWKPVIVDFAPSRQRR